MSYFEDEDGNDVEVSFQLHAELFAEWVLDSLSSQRSLLEGEIEFHMLESAKMQVQLLDKDDESPKRLLEVRIELAQDAIGHLQERLTDLEYSKMSVELALDEIRVKPEGWMLYPGEHEEWIAHHRARIAKAIGNPRGN